MKKVNLRDLYPDVYKNDHFVEVTEDVLETIRAAERAEGMEFDGEIEFYHFDEEICQKCKKYLIQNLEKFNDGIYRLGGSKSRGYGKIHVSILEDGREDSEEL